MNSNNKRTLPGIAKLDSMDNTYVPPAKHQKRETTTTTLTSNIVVDGTVPTMVDDIRTTSGGFLYDTIYRNDFLEKSKKEITKKVETLADMVHRKTTSFASIIMINKIDFDTENKTADVQYIESNTHLETFNRKQRKIIIGEKLVANAKDVCLSILDVMPESPFEIKRFAEQFKADVLNRSVVAQANSNTESVCMDQVTKLNALFLVLKIWNERLEETIIPDLDAAKVFMIPFNRLTKNTYPTRFTNIQLPANFSIEKSYGLFDLISSEHLKVIFGTFKGAEQTSCLPNYLPHIVKNISSKTINETIDSRSYCPEMLFTRSGGVCSFIPSRFFSKVYQDTNLGSIGGNNNEFLPSIKLTDDTIIPETQLSENEGSELLLEFNEDIDTSSLTLDSDDEDSVNTSIPNSSLPLSTLSSVGSFYNRGMVYPNNTTLSILSAAAFKRYAKPPTIGTITRLENSDRDVEDIEDFSDEHELGNGVDDDEQTDIPALSEPESEGYQIENVVGVGHTEDGEKIWRVKWEGYDDSYNTWESLDQFLDCDPDTLHSKWRRSIARRRTSKQ